MIQWPKWLRRPVLSGEWLIESLNCKRNWASLLRCDGNASHDGSHPSMHAWLRQQYCIFYLFADILKSNSVRRRKRKVFVLFFLFCNTTQHAYRFTINASSGLDWTASHHTHPITSKHSNKSNHRLNNSGMSMGKMFVSRTKIWDSKAAAT